MSLPPVLKILAHIISQKFSFQLFSLGVLEYWAAFSLSSNILGVLVIFLRSLIPLSRYYCCFFGITTLGWLIHSNEDILFNTIYVFGE